MRILFTLVLFWLAAVQAVAQTVYVTPFTRSWLYATNAADGRSRLGLGTNGISLLVREIDGAPSVSSVATIRVSNGTLVDNGGGDVTLTTGGGGGGGTPGGNNNDVQINNAGATFAGRALNPTQLTLDASAIYIPSGSRFTNSLLIAPNIADFSSAQHDHLGTSGGGNLSASAITSGTFAKTRVSSTGTWADAEIPSTLSANARVAVARNSEATTGTRRRINFIEGANITLTVSDDSVGEEVEVTINASGSTGYTTLQEEGTPITQRGTLDFVGAALTAADTGSISRVTLSQSPASASVVGTGRLVSTGSGIGGGGDFLDDGVSRCGSITATSQ